MAIRQLGAGLLLYSLGGGRPFPFPTVVIARNYSFCSRDGLIEIGASVEHRTEYSLSLIPENSIVFKQQRTHNVILSV
jgi:hypothetical protein